MNIFQSLLSSTATSAAGAAEWDPDADGNLLWRLCPSLDGVVNGYEYPALIDQSGNGYNSDTQATTTKRANYVSTGGPISGYAEFDGDDSYIMRTAFDPATIASMLLIFRAPVTFSPLDSIINTRNASGNAWVSANIDGSGINHHFSANWGYAEANGTNITTLFNQTYQQDGWPYPVGEWSYLYITGGTTTATGFDICTDNGARDPVIDIAEICVWTSSLSAGTENAMYNYLSNTNGLNT